MFKTCLIAFGNVFGHSQNVKVFPASWSCSKFWHSWVHWALFFRESYLKTSSKQVWTLLGTFLDTFQILKVRFFFHFSPFFDPAGHDDFKKNHLVTCLNTVGYVFGHFWKFEFLFDFFWSFSSRDPPVCTSHFFSKKIPQNEFRTYLDAIRNRFGHFRNIEIFHIFHLSSLEPPGCSEQQFYRKNFLETFSKHVWLLLGTFLCILKMWKFFQFLEVVPGFDIPGCNGHFYSAEVTSKQVQNLFWHF